MQYSLNDNTSFNYTTSKIGAGEQHEKENPLNPCNQWLKIKILDQVQNDKC